MSTFPDRGRRRGKAVMKDWRPKEGISLMEDPSTQAPRKDPEPLIDMVDIEEYGKRGERPPRARQYKIRIDKAFFTVDHPTVTGRELLTLAGKVPPERFEIFQKLHGGQMKKVSLDEKVDLAQPGIERFQTIPLEATEG